MLSFVCNGNNFICLLFIKTILFDNCINKVIPKIFKTVLNIFVVLVSCSVNFLILSLDFFSVPLDRHVFVENVTAFELCYNFVVVMALIFIVFYFFKNSFEIYCVVLLSVSVIIISRNGEKVNCIIRKTMLLLLIILFLLYKFRFRCIY